MLSATEAGRLEHWGIWPSCKKHRHVKQRVALAGAQAGLYRFLGGEDTEVKTPVSMVTLVSIRQWTPVQAHSADGKTVLGLRTWGLKPAR